MKKGTGKVIGQVISLRLDAVQPNTWNPNEFTPELMKSLEYGLREDGWLASQAMLVWGSDDKGVQRNLIIDGEHRWLGARNVGFTEGPAVVLDGISEARAKALTVALDRKRGTFNDQKLAEVVKSIQFDGTYDNLSMALGFGEEEYMKLLAEVPTDAEVEALTRPGRDELAEGVGALGSLQDDAPPAQVKMVQVFFTPEQHAAFTERCVALGKAWGQKTISDTVREAVMRAEPG